jgi:L-ascorbate metabolism protein UlaG (beta-lactamase superfamily)
MIRVAVMLLFCCVASSAVHGHDAESRYLGNEGVLVSSGETKVMFDAFYNDSYGQYVLVSDDTRDRMMAAEAPFDGVDALVVSHVHGDHFSAEPTLAYLRANPAVQFFGPMQAVEALKAIAAESDASLLARLNGVDLSPGQSPAAIRRPGLLVEAVAIPHSGGAQMAHIDNLAFRVTLGMSPTVLHLGDAGTVDADFAAQQSFWDQRRPDAAYPPFWFYLDEAGRQILESRIQAAQVIGIHVPARAAGEGDGWREQMKGDLFTDPGETRAMPHAAH